MALSEAEAKKQLEQEAAMLESTGFGNQAQADAAKANPRNAANVVGVQQPTTPTPPPSAPATKPAVDASGQTAAQLGEQVGVNQDEVMAEMAKYPDLNPDAVVGNILTRKKQEAAGATPASAPEKKAEGEPAPVYKVAAGDNLTKIAKMYGTTVSAIMAANPQITNPNLIFPGQALNIPQGGLASPFKMPSGYEQINGAAYPTAALQEQNFTDIQVDPTGTFLYGKRIEISDTVNGEQEAAFNALESGTDSADVNIRESTKAAKYQEKVDEMLGMKDDPTATPDTITTSDGTIISLQGDSTALSLYNELMRSKTITSLAEEIATKQEEMDKITATELALAEDIRKEVEGEAPQSYIDALVAERMKDLYPRKVALAAEQRNLIAQYNAEKENAANVLQFTLRDEENRYNRMFAALQFAAQQDQNAFSNQLGVLSLLKDMPVGRSVTIDGKTYKGLNEDAALNIVQFTDAAGKITVVGIDKLTGEIKYSKVIGQAKVSGSGSSEDTWAKRLSELVAQLSYNRLEDYQAGKLAEAAVPDKDGILQPVIVDATAYGSALQEWSDAGTGWVQGWGDTTVNFNGKTYQGKTSTMPFAEDYVVVNPKTVTE